MASEKFSALVEIKGGVATSFNSSVTQSVSAVGKLQKELGRLSKARGQITRFTEGGKKIEGLSKKLDGAKGNLKKLQTEFANTPKASAAMIAGLERAKAKVTSLETSLEKEKATLNKTGEALRRAGVDTGNLANEQARLEKHAKRVANVMSRQHAAQTRFTNSREGMRKWAMAGAAVAGVGYTMFKPVKAAADYQESEIDFSKFVQGADTVEGLKAVGDEVLQIGKNSLLGAKGVGKLLVGYSKLGMAKDEAMAAAKGTEVLAVGLELTADEAADTVVSLKQNMRMSIDEMMELGDAVNYIGDLTAAGQQSTINILKRQGGFVKSVTKLANNEIVALAAAFDSTKMGPEIASTAMKNFVGALTRGKGAQKAEIKAWNLIGMDPVKIAGEMQKDGRATIMKVMKAIEKVNDRDRSYVLTKIFKKESIGIVSSLLSNLEGVEEILYKLDDKTKYLGRSQGEYNRQLSGFNSKWTVLKNKIEIGLIKIGKNYLPYMSKFLDKVGAGMEKAFGWIERNPKTFNKVTMAVAGIFLLTSAVVGLGLALSTVKFALAGFNLGLANLAVRRLATRSALRETSAVLAADAAMMTAPVPVGRKKATPVAKMGGKRGMAGVAVGSASLLSVKGWGRALSPIGKMIGAFGRGLGFLLKPVTLLRLGFVKFALVLKSILVPVLSAIGTGLSALFSPIGIVVGIIVAAGVSIWKYWMPIKKFLVGFGSEFIKSIQPVIDRVKDLWVTFDRAVGITSGFSKGLAWVSDAAGKARQWIKALFTPISETAEITKRATEAGREWGTLIGGWITEKLAFFSQTLKNVIAYLPVLKVKAQKAFETINSFCMPIVQRVSAFFLKKLKPVIDLVSDGIDRLKIVVGKMAKEIKGRGLPVIKLIGAAAIVCMSPINMLIAAIGFVAIIIRRHWEPIKSFVKGFGESFMQAIQPARELLVRLRDATVAYGHALVSLFKTLYEVSGLSKIIDGVILYVVSLARSVGNLIVQFDECIGFSEKLGEVWEWVCEKAESFWQWFTNLLDPISKTADETKKAGDAGREWGKIIGGVVVRGLGKFVSILEKAPEKIKKMEDGLVSAFKKIKEFCQPILNKLNDGLGWLDKNFGSLDETLHTLSFGVWGESKDNQKPLEEHETASLTPSVKPAGYYSERKINRTNHNTVTIHIDGSDDPQKTAFAVRDALNNLPGEDDSSMMDDPVLIFA